MTKRMNERKNRTEAVVTRRELLQGAAAVGAGLCLPRSARAHHNDPLKKTTLRFNWTAKGEFTPLYVARELGFFKEQGVEVELLEGKSGTQAVQVVGTGNDAFGFVPSIQVIQAINQGIPLRVAGTFGRVTGMCWASWPDVPLVGPKSLEGRKISLSSASTFFQVWPAFVKKFKIDTAKVEVVNADPSARVGLFLSHRLDIMADIFVANDFVVLQNKLSDKKLHLLRLADLSFDPIGYVLFANQSVIERDPDLVRRVTHGTQKGFQKMIDSPNDAIEIMTRLFGDRLGAPIIQGQVDKLLTLVNREPKLGMSNEADWQRSLDLLQEAGVIDKKLPLGSYYTNDFLQV